MRAVPLNPSSSPIPRWRGWLAAVLAAIALGACGGGGGGGGGSDGSTGSGTEGSGAGGSTTLTVATDPLRATLAADTARAVTQAVPLAGGTLTATGADGTVYTLTVPADALLEATTITMTPLSSVAVPGLATSAGYGVQLEPAGTRFSNFLTLQITLPTGTTLPVDRQLPIGWSGEDNTVSLAAMDAGSSELRLRLLHFSGYALLLATQGTNATLEPARHRLGGDVEQRLASIAAERLLQERQRQLLGQAGEPVVLDDLFKEFDEKVLQPRIAAAGSSCAAGRLAIQTALGRSRQRQLLGIHDDDVGTRALYGDIMASASAACTREEYALCRDEHIITRMLPYYLGLRRQAALLGLATADPAGDPVWVQEAADATGKCLNFELQFDSQMVKSDGVDVNQRTVRENVSARLRMPFNLGAAIFGEGGFYAATSQAPDTLASTSYSVSYPHSCASTSNVQGVAAGMLASLGFEPEAGGVAQRARVKDFYLTPAAIPSGFGSQYTVTLRTPRGAGCEDPTTHDEYENWFVDGFPTIVDAFADPNLSAAIRGWNIVGGDVMATKEFTTRLSEGTTDVTVNTQLVLFHKPAP